MARRLASESRGEHGVVPYLQPRAHKCILTDAFESRSASTRTCHTSHRHASTPTYPTLRDAQVPGPLNNVRHIRARVYTHNTRENAGVRERRAEANRGRALATLFHEHNLHYRAMQAVNSGAQVAVLTLDLLAASAFEYF